MKGDSINEPTEPSEGEIENLDNIYISTQPLADEMSFNILKPVIVQQKPPKMQYQTYANDILGNKEKDVYKRLSLDSSPEMILGD